MLETATSSDWTVPIELVRHITTPNGFAFLIRAEAMGAVFQPDARVFLRGGRFVAQVDFARPIGPEKQDGLVLMLTAIPGEHR